MDSLNGRIYLWSSTSASALDKVARKMGVSKDTLIAKPTGLVRPGGYDYEGNSIDGYKENIGKTLRRWVVGLK